MKIRRQFWSIGWFYFASRKPKVKLRHSRNETWTSSFLEVQVPPKNSNVQLPPKSWTSNSFSRAPSQFQTQSARWNWWTSSRNWNMKHWQLRWKMALKFLEQSQKLVKPWTRTWATSRSPRRGSPRWPSTCYTSEGDQFAITFYRTSSLSTSCLKQRSRQQQDQGLPVKTSCLKQRSRQQQDHGLPVTNGLGAVVFLAARVEEEEEGEGEDERPARAGEVAHHDTRQPKLRWLLDPEVQVPPLT